MEIQKFSVGVSLRESKKKLQAGLAGVLERSCWSLVIQGYCRL